MKNHITTATLRHIFPRICRQHGGKKHIANKHSSIISSPFWNRSANSSLRTLMLLLSSSIINLFFKYFVLSMVALKIHFLLLGTTYKRGGSWKVSRFRVFLCRFSSIWYACVPQRTLIQRPIVPISFRLLETGPSSPVVDVMNTTILSAARPSPITVNSRASHHAGVQRHLLSLATVGPLFFFFFFLATAGTFFAAHAVSRRQVILASFLPYKTFRNSFA